MNLSRKLLKISAWNFVCFLADIWRSITENFIKFWDGWAGAICWTGMEWPITGCTWKVHHIWIWMIIANLQWISQRCFCSLCSRSMIASGDSSLVQRVICLKHIGIGLWLELGSNLGICTTPFWKNDP